MMNVPRKVGIVFRWFLEQKDRKSGQLLRISQYSLAVVCQLSKPVIIKEPLLVSCCFSLQSIASARLTDPPPSTEFRICAAQLYHHWVETHQ
jgi:hypothetical protein